MRKIHPAQFLGCRQTIRAPTPSHTRSRSTRTPNTGLKFAVVASNVVSGSSFLFRPRAGSLHPWSVRVADDDDLARLDPVARGEPDGNRRGHRREAEDADRGRDHARKSRAHPTTSNVRAGEGSGHRRSCTGRALDRQRAAERSHPVLHDLQPLAALHAIRLEARPAVADRERHRARTVGERQVDSPTRGVPLGVLKRLDAAEVDRRLHRRVVPRVRCAAQDRELRLVAGSARERAERGSEALVGQQRWEDAARDLAQVVERDGACARSAAPGNRARRRDPR